MNDEPMNCSSCKHWQPNFEDGRWGWCKKIRDDNWENGPHLSVYAEDGYESVFLMTPRDFYCNQFEAMP